MEKFYITTAIPYVNAKPHVGHALEFVQADTIARYHRIKGDKTILLSGGDENALKNIQAAEKAGVGIQEFVDRNSMLFEDLAKALDVQFDVFQKGSSKDHHSSSQKLWEKCEQNGDIYKKTYTGLYCVGCEAFYEPSELNENGECFEHPGKKLEEVSEENYFFKLSNYTDQILQILESNQIKIIPDSRKNEMVSFVKQGLNDISISRSNARAKDWGVSVPNDPTQKMYVWFDALNIYRSGVENQNAWPADVHVIGKGILRFHAVYWPAFLLSANLALPKSIFVHGYFTVDGQKMSKTLGNVIDPFELINKYGADALRYYLLSQIPSTEDGDFSEEKLKTVYNADLANGLGNLCARVAALAKKNKVLSKRFERRNISQNTKKSIDQFDFNTVLKNIWQEIRLCDQKINTYKAWELEAQEQANVLSELIDSILQITADIAPFLPETSNKIEKHFTSDFSGTLNPLFPRIA